MSSCSRILPPQTLPGNCRFVSHHLGNRGDLNDAIDSYKICRFVAWEHPGKSFFVGPKSNAESSRPDGGLPPSRRADRSGWFVMVYFWHKWSEMCWDLIPRCTFSRQITGNRRESSFEAVQTNDWLPPWTSENWHFETLLEVSGTCQTAPGKQANHTARAIRYDAIRY